MKSLVVLFAVMLLAVSCASSGKKDQQIVEERASKSTVHDPKTLGGTIHDAVEKSSLPEEKKQALRAVLEANKAKAVELYEKSYKYRAVLIEELLSKDMSAKRVKIIKKDIKKVEAAKLKNTFETVEKISKIVNDHPNKSDFTQHLINYDRATR